MEKKILKDHIDLYDYRNKTIVLKCELENCKCPTMHTEFNNINEACKAYVEATIALKNVPHWLGLYKIYTDTETNKTKEVLIDFNC